MEIWVLIVPLWPGLLSWEVKQALSYISPGKVTQTRREGAGLPEQGQLHSLIFLVTNTHLLLLLASSTLGDPESLGRWERLVVSGTWLQGDLEGHTPPQAKASSLGTGRHLRAALSDTEPHFSCLYLSITLLCGPCSLGTCQIYHLPEPQYWPRSASKESWAMEF